MSETAYERLTRALREHRFKIVERRGRRGEADAQCPAHDDNNPSLGIRDRGDRALIVCRSNRCRPEDIVGELGLTLADLYNEPPTAHRPIRYVYDGGRVVTRAYKANGKKKILQENADSAPPTLFHAARLAEVPEHRHVFLVEGEEDVLTLEANGVVATTAPQGAGNFDKVDVSPLAGKLVVCVVDRDDAGDMWAAQVAAKLEGVAKRYRFVRAREGHDTSEHFAAGLDVDQFEPYEPPTVTTEAEPPRPEYGDVAGMLAGGIPDPPQPEVLFRCDGNALLYTGKVNVLYGDSESGKTWIALAALVEVLGSGGKAAVLDLDHNGMAETVTRMLALGAKPADLGDLARFRYCEPGDDEELLSFVDDLAAWEPWAVVADSLGEILPMLGLSSNSPDDYTKANRAVLTPLAVAGSAVLAVDHLPKDDAAREKGQTGTMAKKRAVNGVSLRVTVKDQFTPGLGGSANLTISKDRPGGLRGHCPSGRNAPAGRFVMTDAGDGTLSWHITNPVAAVPSGGAPDGDVAELDGLVPPPRSQRDVKERLNWGGTRAMNALQKWRELRQCPQQTSR